MLRRYPTRRRLLKELADLEVEKAVTEQLYESRITDMAAAHQRTIEALQAMFKVVIDERL